MYKDKDKQREANAERQRRYRRGPGRRSALQGVTKGVTSEGVTDKSVTGIDKALLMVRDELKQEGEFIEELVKSDVLNVKPERTAQGNIRVSKPGDADYVPQCETTRAFIEDRPKRPETAKRGKDIKCFADLPPDVQQTIDRLSTVDGKIDQTVKANRTAIAVNYQHLFPDRYYTTGVAI